MKKIKHSIVTFFLSLLDKNFKSADYEKGYAHGYSDAKDIFKNKSTNL